MSQPIARVWTFQSDSNTSREYETLQYTDGSTSCNCPGWTRRVAADGSRSCKHTRLVDQGRADSHSVASHDYEPLNHQRTYAKTKIKNTPRLGQRKLAV